MEKIDCLMDNLLVFYIRINYLQSIKELTKLKTYLRKHD